MRSIYDNLYALSEVKSKGSKKIIAPSYETNLADSFYIP